MGLQQAVFLTGSGTGLEAVLPPLFLPRGPHRAAARAGGRWLARRDLVILDELGYLPFAQTGGQLLFHLVSRLYEPHISCTSPPA